LSLQLLLLLLLRSSGGKIKIDGWFCRTFPPAICRQCRRQRGSANEKREQMRVRLSGYARIARQHARDMVFLVAFEARASGPTIRAHFRVWDMRG